MTMAKSIAVLLDDGFEDSNYRILYDRLRAVGHEVHVIGRKGHSSAAGRRDVERVAIEAAAEDRQPDDFDALLIPGGHAPDQLRTDDAVVDFVKRFCFSGKPVAAICHGPQLLIEADVVHQHNVTAAPAVETDLKNAGAMWIDEPVVEDPPFITARDQRDIEPFVEALLSSLK
jgi:protease I